MRAQKYFPAIFLLFLLTACTRAAPVDTTAFTPLAPANVSLPTLAPVQTYLPPTRSAGTPVASPTPNVQIILPTFTPLSAGQFNLDTATPGPVTYVVQSGNFLGQIAESYGISTEELAAANGLDPVYGIIYPGDVLLIPISPEQASLQATPNAVRVSSDYFKIIPDSELVYSPLATLLNIEAFVRQQGGYLAYYSQEVEGEILSGGQIVRRVALNYSVNPRLLLAVLEYRSQWVTNPSPAPSTLETPIGYIDETRVGLYRQLAWAADKLNQGFYGWNEGKIEAWQLVDGTLLMTQPGINPGTAGVQHLFAKLDDQSTWRIDTGPNGLYAAYSQMFGYPFDWAIEPILPAGLSQPALILPFEKGDVWAYTGGPHGGWDSGSAWAAIDFAPPGEPMGCAQTGAWVTAIADGKIVRSENGAVVQDLDGDGLEQTGWTILYMHIETRDRVALGQYLRAGERIGHSSCEGGFSNANHLHLARRYNGVWIAADAPELSFVMDGWAVSGSGVEYDGWLTRDGLSLEAWEIVGPINQIQRP
ncbi:MAG: LysM peptidoglycan-binding domain-containing M23 family metallopeptidase [Anaerolineales bacterium]|jgi:murein DD-endopeptidase MepM/ murein hydrolase activator NlpD|nr:LysM peptidoglycan-binding domain-containing M23 family metallopeptidase [Anaerolineales bacterium]